VKFSVATNKKYPIDTVEHIRASWRYINKAGNASKYSADEVASIKRKIIAAWKDKIDKDGPPSAGKSLAYAKSLGLVLPDEELTAVICASVKSVEDGIIGGYLALWGSENLTDVEAEYFTPMTDFWDAKLGKAARPLTWDHAQDLDFKDADPVIGMITDFGDDEVGRWYEAKLDRSHRYHKAIVKLIQTGKIGTSSDSAPQYVQRVKTGKSTWLKQWPLFAAALTDVPAEPRMIGSMDIIKNLGIALPEPENAKQRWEWDQQIARLLKLSI